MYVYIYVHMCIYIYIYVYELGSCSPAPPADRHLDRQAIAQLHSSLPWPPGFGKQAQPELLWMEEILHRFCQARLWQPILLSQSPEVGAASSNEFTGGARFPPSTEGLLVLGLGF